MARVERHPGGWWFHGIEVLAGQSGVLGCWFWVDLDENWGTREVAVRAAGRQGGRTLSSTADADHRRQLDGARRPDPDGRVDVDMTETPLTGTFPGS